MRDDVLEDACRVSLNTGAQIEFDFNGVKCVVQGFLRNVDNARVSRGEVSSIGGVAIFMGGETYERIGIPGKRLEWKMIPASSNATAAPAESPAGGNA